MSCHVAHRVDVRIRALQRSVDRDALIGEFESCRPGQLDIRLNADADEHRFSGHRAAVAELYGLDMPVAREARNPRASEPQIHAMLTMQIGKHRSHLLTD